MKKIKLIHIETKISEEIPTTLIDVYLANGWVIDEPKADKKSKRKVVDESESESVKGDDIE